MLLVVLADEGALPLGCSVVDMVIPNVAQHRIGNGDKEWRACPPTAGVLSSAPSMPGDPLGPNQAVTPMPKGRLLNPTPRHQASDRAPQPGILNHLEGGWCSLFRRLDRNVQSGIECLPHVRPRDEASQCPVTVGALYVSCTQPNCSCVTVCRCICIWQCCLANAYRRPGIILTCMVWQAQRACRESMPWMQNCYKGKTTGV